MRILRHARWHIRLKKGLPFFAYGGMLLVWLAPWLTVNITVDFHKNSTEECPDPNGAPGEAASSDSAARSVRGHARQTSLNQGLLVSLSGPFFGLLT